MENIPPETLEADDELKDSQTKRLQYLLKQAEIYSHFVTSASSSTVSTANRNRKRKVLAPVTDAHLTNEKKRKWANGASKTEGEEDIKEAAAKVMKYDTTPDFIVGKMHDYQIHGLNWLISLCANGIGGVLGDEMGLGKTLQTLSVLGYLKNVQKKRGPFLVIAPLSTLPNWLKEANRFCPSLEAFVLYGTKDVRSKLLDRLKSKSPHWDLCITNYETCRTNKGIMQRVKWNFVVLDEGHKIKNETTQTHKVVRGLTAVHRLILTGTPLNNNLHELWALLSYLLPDVFTDSDDFDSWFDSDACLRGNNEIVERLQVVLQPFMLRRVKADVLTSLLPKKETKLYIPMTALQRDTYKMCLFKHIKSIDALGQVAHKGIRNITMTLRHPANHPYLIENVEPGPPYTTDQHLVDNCGKMIVLDQLLAKLKANGSRVVLFSQFVMMLNIIEDYLIWKDYKYCRMDGNTKIDKRVEDIDNFNAEGSETFIYIISTRAGGLGINLATADTVIIYDSDWNPQADFQAIDRVHRIGQKKQVHIFRLITENTVDHRIVDRAKIKQRLEKIVIHHAPTQPETSSMIAGLRLDMERAMSERDADEVKDFDLQKILQKSSLKEAAEEERLEKMTFEEYSATSVYQFEGSDYRNIAGAGPSSQSN